MQKTYNAWLALLVLCAGFFVILLDTTIVNVAIPTMLTSLHASLDQILWVVNAYLLALAVLLITGGRLGDIFGQRNLFMFGLGAFVLASALCGLAQDPNQLIAARILQGVGAAVLSPQALVIVSALFPPERRGAALGVLAAVTSLASLAGPLLGGVIVTYLNWRWIFLVNLPIGAAGILLASRFVPDLRPGRAHSLDLVGVALASAGLFGIVFGLIDGQRYDWGAVAGIAITIPEVIGAGVVLLLGFLFWESRQAEPLLPLALFRNRNFSIMAWLSGLNFFAMFGFTLTMTIYMQSVLGWSAIKSGLTTIPITAGIALVSPFAGRLTDRLGGRYILMGGAALFATGVAWAASVVSLSASSFTFTAPLAVVGIGMGLMISPIMTEAMREVAPALAGAASGLLNTSRQVGAAIGAAVIGAVLQNQLGSALHDHAVSASSQLPLQLRASFVAGFDGAARQGLSVGRGQSGAALPPGLPPQAVELVQRLVHDTFVSSYIVAMRPALLVAASALLIGSLSCILMVGRQRPAATEIEEVPLELAS